MLQVLHALLWLYEVWEGTFLEDRFMDTDLKDLALPCNLHKFCEIQARN